MCLRAIGNSIMPSCLCAWLLACPLACLPPSLQAGLPTNPNSSQTGLSMVIMMAPKVLQIPLRGPSFCPFSKRNGACNRPHFPMILRWHPILKWDGASKGPRSHSRFAENLGQCFSAQLLKIKENVLQMMKNRKSLKILRNLVTDAFSINSITLH